MDLHKISTKQTGEHAIAGVVSGLMELGDQVTWRAKHLGIWQTLTSKITAMEAPDLFVDEMVKGAFKSFRHEHHFKPKDGAVLMIDHFEYFAPLGWLGNLADRLFLENYVKRLLLKRNQVIKAYAESDKWQTILPY
ncbi:MAG: SRPBCC family protein [Cyclobacteriaceae bacterium]